MMDRTPEEGGTSAIGMDAIEATAIDWIIRMRQETFADWEDLSEWMDADRRHAESFNRLSLRDAEAADAVRQLPAFPRPTRITAPTIALTAASRPGAQRHWMRLAASILLPVVLAGGWMLSKALRPAATTTELVLSTQPGEQRGMAFADGTRVTLAGATRLSMDPSSRHATLLAGRATFRVTPDAEHPFSVRLGEATVTDVGTVFDIHRWQGVTDVAVAEGEVRIDAAGQSLEVSAGQAVRIGDGTPLRAVPIRTAEVGAWRRGRFDYSDATVAEVAADVADATGARIELSPDVARQRFAGSIQVSGDVGETLHSLAPLLGATARQSGHAWILSKPADAGIR